MDGLDLEQAGFERVQPNRTGRRGYRPADLLKLHLYGYLNRIRSSRRLEAETHRNLEVIWLLRRLQPDFKTIADFRHDNREAFRQVFRDFVRLCRELDIYGRELLAVDGTRIKAVNNVNRNFTRAKLERELSSAEERLERYLRQMDEADADDAGGSAVVDLEAKIAALRERRTTLEGYRDKLEESGRGQLSLTDPDSRVMRTGKGGVVGYNVQIAVDVKHSLIAEQQVYNNLNDFGLLAQTAVAARENLAVEGIDAVADKGYYKIDDIEACEACGVTPHVPKRWTGPRRRKRGFSPSPGSATTARRTATAAPAAIACDRPISTNLPAGPGFNTSTGRLVDAVHCGRAARMIRIVASPATRTKPSWSAWANAWPRGLT